MLAACVATKDNVITIKIAKVLGYAYMAYKGMLVYSAAQSTVANIIPYRCVVTTATPNMITIVHIVSPTCFLAIPERH